MTKKTVMNRELAGVVYCKSTKSSRNTFIDLKGYHVTIGSEDLELVNAFKWIPRKHSHGRQITL